MKIKNKLFKLLVLLLKPLRFLTYFFFYSESIIFKNHLLVTIRQIIHHQGHQQVSTSSPSKILPTQQNQLIH